MYDSFRLLYTCLYTFLYICPSVFFVCLSCCIPVLTSSQQPPFLPMLTYRILPCCFNSFNFCRIFPWEYPVYSAISAVVSRFWLKKAVLSFEYSPAFFHFGMDMTVRHHPARSCPVADTQAVIGINGYFR